MSKATVCNGCGKIGPSIRFYQNAPVGWSLVILLDYAQFHLCEECVPILKCRIMDRDLFIPSSPTTSPPTPQSPEREP
jgi:hypothetical protein